MQLSFPSCSFPCTIYLLEPQHPATLRGIAPPATPPACHYPQDPKHPCKGLIASARRLVWSFTSGTRKHEVAVICDQMRAAVSWQGLFVTVINPLSHTASRYFLCHCYFYFFANKDCRLRFASAHIRLDSSPWQGELHTWLAPAEGKNCVLGFASFCNYYEMFVGGEVPNSTRNLSDINNLLTTGCENSPSIILNISERLDSRIRLGFFFPSPFPHHHLLNAI